MVDLLNDSSLGLVVFHSFFKVSHHELFSFRYGSEVALRFALIGQMSHDTLIFDPILFHLRATDEALFESGVISAIPTISRIFLIELSLNALFHKSL